MDAYSDLKTACSEASDRGGPVYLYFAEERNPIRTASILRITPLEHPFPDMFLKRCDSI